jgi:uncharacterized delta-60 repeat protein
VARTPRLWLPLTIIALLTPVAPAQGAAGLLDPTFGAGGLAILDEPAEINEQLQDVVVLPEGKILGAGSKGSSSGFLLARFNPDGTPDLSFGSGGIRIEPDTKVPGAPRTIVDIERRGDDKVLAVGLGRSVSTNAFIFGRYLPSGDLDPQFGKNGLRLVSFITGGNASALALAPDGRVVGVGDNGSAKEAMVVRLTEEGDLDSSFNLIPLGVRPINVPGAENEHARAVRVLADGTILVGGSSLAGAFLAELSADGKPVPGFGNAGIAVHNLGTGGTAFGSIEALSLLPDGRFLGAGITNAGTGDRQLIVARFTAGGALDPSFGAGGVFRSNPTAEDDEAFAMALQPDGKIVVAGARSESGDERGDTWVLRLSPEGQLDPTFGVGGETVISASPDRDLAEGLALQPDGRAVFAGIVGQSGLRLLAGRLTADSPAAPAVTPGRCAGRVATITGTQGADGLRGTNKADVFAALGGEDSINALAGNDIVCGGAGRDHISLGKGRDQARGEGGPDMVRGGPGNDRLLGGAGKDKLIAGRGRDLCNGGAGKDPTATGCERKKKLP